MGSASSKVLMSSHTIVAFHLIINKIWVLNAPKALLVPKKRPTPVPKPETSTFSLLAQDKTQLEHVRRRVAVLGSALNKSEAVRLSLLAVDLVEDAQLVELLTRLQRLRPGRAL